MTIRHKILIVIGLTLVSLLLCLQLVSTLVLRNGFSRIERADAREDVSRVRAALDEAISKIDSTAGDWAWWDDTYRFVTDHNPSYARSNLGAESISNLRLNIVVFVSPSGKIRFGTGFDLQKNIKVPLATAFQRQLVASNPPFHPATLQGSKQGLILLPEGPLLVAARSILTSSKRGPSHGTLIFGRILSANELSGLSKLTRFPLELQRLDAPLAAQFRGVRPLLSASNRIETQIADNDTLWGYALIDDIYGHPALILRVALPRDVHHQEENTLHAMFVSLLVACFAFCAVMFLLLERVVLGRLESLNRDVRHITHQHDLVQRVDLTGQDELGLLARAINELLDTIAHEQQKLAVANSKLAGLNGKLETINQQLEKQAMQDELTQLSNRRAFNSQLKTEMERATRYQTPLSLLLLDIDRFKHINDTWGHSYGDEVLQRVAVLLQSALRSTDLAARYGGEEMAVILPNTSAEGALAIAERCRAFIEAGPWQQGQVTASFGVATLRIGMESTAFIAAADIALYTSKKEGRNRSTHSEAVMDIPRQNG